jgi:hypothetical protein
MSTFLLQRTAVQQRSELASVAFAVLLFVALYLMTVPERIGDTAVYAGDIVGYMQGGAPTLLWEFGHLLWRPIGYGLWLVAHPWMSSLSLGRPINEVMALLFGVNFIAGLALTVLVFAICRRLGLGNGAALGVTGGALLCNPILNYVHSGSAYIPGLTVHLAGLWLILKSVQTSRKAALNALLGGIAVALAFCLWFPYVLSIPATLLAGWFAPSHDGDSQPLAARERGRLLAMAFASAAVTGAALLLAGVVAAKISSLPALIQWMISGGHGYHPAMRLLRSPTGFTRSFIYMAVDDEGVMLKRFVFGDPYAPVRWINLLFAGIWKLALVFGAFAGLLVGLARRRKGWPALAVVVCGILPTFLFAVLIFEPSSEERYLPAYPALIFAVCGLVRQTAGSRATRFGLAAFALALAAVNLKEYGWDVRATSALASARARLIRAHADGHGDVTLLLSSRDRLEEPGRLPFAPINSQAALRARNIRARLRGSLPLAPIDPQGALRTYEVADPGNNSILTWQHDSACRILLAWNNGGNAWLSMRLLAPRPQPSWNWAEYDDRHIRWVDLPEFFSQLATDTQIGEEDGFRRVARTEDNRRLLQGYCGADFPK